MAERRSNPSQNPVLVDCLNITSYLSAAHRVRPADIKVVGAIGDSITAANGAGACTVPGVAIEYRGRSWSIGGDGALESLTERVVTIPSKHMPIQARRLIDKMKNHPSVDFENDWKLVTLFIGGNDLCQYCDNPNKFDPHQYIEYIDEALTLMQEELPRTIVNVVVILNVPQIELLSSPKCDAVHLVVCDCAMFLPNETAAHLQQVTANYQDWTIELVESGKFDTKEDFTAVSQPFFTKTDTPMIPETGEPDFSFFAPDCFHFSSKGHTASAGELWNNMLMPVGKKRTTWLPFSDLICPTKEHPFIFTNVNSREDFELTEPPPTIKAAEPTSPSRAHTMNNSLTLMLLLLFTKMFIQT
ncbi:phospholipase B1, membrane-associated-like [Anneissia japonica]|uniref:phospholipase B1, membrane-associated-like n=1 Tax=Anneissia japonica TaxID=1529436 RepID=UPI0014256C01|nr:phospholipase B1, membrane-associated-like [Anneissia japonica]